MDAEYLKENVGGILAEGLARVAIQRPDDSIECLANFLLNHVRSRVREDEEREQREVLAKAASQQTARTAQQEAKVADAAAPASLRAEDVDSRVAELERALHDAQDVQAALRVALDKLCGITGAQGAYIGVRERGEEEQPAVVRFVAASAGQEFVTKGHEVREGEGVIFDAWALQQANAAAAEATEEQEATEEEAGEEEQEGGGDAASTNAARKPDADPAAAALHIPNVLADPRVKFFRYPMLGALLAVPVRYQSSIHADAVDTAALLESVAAASRAPGEGKGEDDEEGSGAEGEDEAREEDAEGKEDAQAGAGQLPPARLRAVDMVLVLDTLGAPSGNGQPFSHPARLAAVRCAQVVAATLERVEAQQYEQEVGLLADLTRSNARLLEEAPARQQALQQAEEDAASKLPEDAFETERRAEVARARFHIGREHARDALQALEGVAQLRIAPKSEVVAALCAAARLSGEEVPADWPVLCERLPALLAAAIEGADPSDAAHATRIADAAQAAEGLQPDEVAQTSAPASILLALVAAAVELRSALEEQQKVEEEAAAAAAAAAAAEAEAEEGAAGEADAEEGADDAEANEDE